MNKDTFLYLLLFIILFYYLCNCCEHNIEDFKGCYRNSSNTLKCKYEPQGCDYYTCTKSSMVSHMKKCFYRYAVKHNIKTAYGNNDNNNVNNANYGSYGGYNGGYFEFTCDDDGKSYINKMTINAGSRIDGLNVTCTNGKTKKVGGNGGKPYNIQDSNGYNKIIVRSGDEIDSLKIGNDSYGGNGGGGPYTLGCTTGNKITGIYGRSGARLDNLGIMCSNN